MLRLLSDEDFHGAIIQGAFLKKADLNLVRVQDVGLSGAKDPAVLAWAAAENRILISHDRKLFSMWKPAAEHKRDEALALLDQVGMKSQADRPCSVLAYGDVKRVELAIAMANSPKLLLMDEPTAGMAPQERNSLMALTKQLVIDRGMAVICIAHAKIEKFEDPESSAYDRYLPRLHKHAAALVCEWSDAVLFATRKFRTQSEDAGFNRKRTIAHAIGRDGGERILRCVGGPSCVAKNRYGISDELPLSWAAFVDAISRNHHQGEINDG